MALFIVPINGETHQPFGSRRALVGFNTAIKKLGYPSSSGSSPGSCPSTFSARNPVTTWYQ
ncbi:hypothetical protein, partial [Glutamicibacter soli]